MSRNPNWFDSNWSPRRTCDTPGDNINQAVPSFGNNQSSIVRNMQCTLVGNIRVDWRETLEAYVFMVDLSGMKKDEVEVEVEMEIGDERTLKISGQRKVERRSEMLTWHLLERNMGKFSRKMKLPENVDIDNVKACMENGVLTVTVPKLKEKKPDVSGTEQKSPTT